ncbi:NEDD8-activating enzyme E1 regulatory subunit [Drechmeria coniospora]|uniref:NEDD8-activating enzyme E1 regulatory subunit n=1 Tax=Drechmeria coniospora TaxID=98403 RepID=A0A151GBT9_DRECN|nr:NEDD8-activating enzyme E1 regulatory subunit [Drechmeria coniospora]KYK54570.1 NEDD8-activating enzyme E1 regulatory subunit [Drechmeria coniospora]
MTGVVAQAEPDVDLLHNPSDKERKYDRQLRLWANSGQAALESANILLVNSGSGTVGVEALKNLVLPGIGRFTIADAAIVCDADLGVNFFLDESCCGKSRAECCTQLLRELNPEVVGDWYPRTKEQAESRGPLHLQQLLESSDAFTVILYTLPLAADQIALLQSYAREHGTPLVSVHSVGFYSFFNVSFAGTVPVVETHPDETASTDLRLLSPWPKLSAFSHNLTKNMEKLDNHEHGHLPLVAILLHYLALWKQAHGGAYPSSYADKIAFRKSVSDAMRRDNPEGGEENFEQAIAAVMQHVTPPSLPNSLRQVFNYRHGDENLRSNFWVISQAVQQFYHEHQQLPLPGGLPDMKAQSNVYVDLQTIYKEKARQDACEVLAVARTIPGGGQIGLEEVEIFCKNAKFLKLVNPVEIRDPCLEHIVEKELEKDEMAASGGPDMPRSLVPLYLALVATSHGSAASASDIVSSIVRRAPVLLGNERVAEVAAEVSRAAGGELHTISAFTGGMVAQEMIKIITKQYIPIDNTYIDETLQSTL